jgi:hypothetical protein
MSKQRAGAVIVQGVLTASAWQAGDLAVQHRLPSLSVTKQFVESGGRIRSERTASVHQSRQSVRNRSGASCV